MQKTLSVIVYGKVQGVFFRQSTMERARETGITGTVSNEKDGTVRIIATGTPEQLSAFTEWCKTGPPRARVDSIAINEIPLETFSTFDIRRR